MKQKVIRLLVLFSVVLMAIFTMPQYNVKVQATEDGIEESSDAKSDDIEGDDVEGDDIKRSRDDIQLNKTELNIVKGKNATLLLKNTEISDVITWTSSNKNIAVVSNNGVVKGIEEGKATITVECKTDSFIVTRKCNVIINSNLNKKDMKFMQKISKICSKTFDFKFFSKSFFISDFLKSEDSTDKTYMKKLFKNLTSVETILKKYKQNGRVIYYTDDNKDFGLMFCSNRFAKRKSEPNYYLYYGYIKNGIRKGQGFYLKCNSTDKVYQVMSAYSKNDYAHGDITYTEYQKNGTVEFRGKAKKGLLDGKGEILYKTNSGPYLFEGVKFKNGKPVSIAKPKSKAWINYFNKEFGGYEKYIKSIKKDNLILVGLCHQSSVFVVLTLSKDDSLGF